MLHWAALFANLSLRHFSKMMEGPWSTFTALWVMICYIPTPKQVMTWGEGWVPSLQLKPLQCDRKDRLTVISPPVLAAKNKRKQNATHSSVAAQTAAQFDTSFLGATRIESTGQKLHYRLMLQKSCDSFGKVTLPPWLISPSLWVQISSLFSWSKTFAIGHPFTETDIYQLVNGSHPSEKGDEAMLAKSMTDSLASTIHPDLFNRCPKKMTSILILSKIKSHHNIINVILFFRLVSEVDCNFKKERERDTDPSIENRTYVSKMSVKHSFGVM